jgi:hypothetical protein
MSRALAIVLGVFVVVIAAIAVPSLLRARISPGEVKDLGDVRTVISAESAYQPANGGYFDVPACLEEPWRCIPGYPENAPAFLEAVLAHGTLIAGARRTSTPALRPLRRTSMRDGSPPRASRRLHT